MKLVMVSNFLGVLMACMGTVLVYFSIELGLESGSIFVEWELFSGLYFTLILTLFMDWVSASFSGFVLLISGGVMIYSSGYMNNDSSFYRFIILVGLFVLSMIFMILSPNMVSILLGWDGLGLVSYCLVIYYQNFKSANAGMLTILSNRIGDVAILLAIAWLFNYGSWNFFYLQFMYKGHMGFILGLVMLAALTKSAQIPFSAWLPAAMAAPTPVSALVHSSTLVTAGVYLLIRFSEVMGVSYLLFFVSAMTMLMSGLGANFEMDLSKIIALSTLSQLGVMMMSLSLGLVDLAYFHLLTHALFKSLLFLCAGVYIHGSTDKQDIRLIGGVSINAPLTSLYFMGCSLALCGFPFMSGFYSKDLILETFFGFSMNLFMSLIIIMATFFTITYSLRLFIYTMKSAYGSESSLMNMEGVETALPMSFLFILATISGSSLGWIFMPGLTVVLPVWVKSLIIIFIIMVGVFSFKNFGLGEADSFNKPEISLFNSFFGTMWWLPVVSVNWEGFMGMGSILIKFLDQGWVEMLGPQGIYLKLSKYYLMVDFFSFLSPKKIMFMTLLFFLLTLLVL